MNINNLKVADEYKKIRGEIHCEISDSDYKRVEQKIESLKEMAKIQNRAISVYDIHKNNFLIKEDNHIKLLGYDSESSIDVLNYHEMISKEDLPYLYDSEIKMYNFLKPIKSAEKKNYKLIYDYRVKNKQSEYIRFLHQMLIYECDKYYNSWLMLIISDVISNYPDNSIPRRFFINTITKEEHLFNRENDIGKYLITKREKEIIELISQGFNSKEIAKKLCVSVNTVNNHRQHILDKTSTKNVYQAITYLKCIGII